MSTKPIIIAICVEANHTESQAVLLLDSIIKFFPCSREYKILLFSPRSNLVLCERNKYRNFSEFEFVEYPEVSNETNNGQRNKIISCCWIEKNYPNSSILFIDTDCVFLGKPDSLFRISKQAGLCPAWFAGIAPHGKDDPAWHLWNHAIKYLDIDAPKTVIESLLGGEMMTPYFNTGCIYADCDAGLFTTWATIFDLLSQDSITQEMLSFGCDDWRYYRPGFFLEQMSFALAVHKTRISYELLENGINYPISYISELGGGDLALKAEDVCLLHYLYYFNSLDAVSLIEKIGGNNSVLSEYCDKYLPLQPCLSDDIPDDFSKKFNSSMRMWREKLALEASRSVR